MALFDRLVPMLKERFASHRIQIEGGASPQIVIPALHPEVGSIVIQEYHQEIIVYAGRFTHGDCDGHFGTRPDMIEEEKERIISEDVLSFLEELLSDRIVMWEGGYRSIDYPRMKSNADKKEYLWSGPRNI